ncbi:hypothetical protein IV203_018302 [Nitzschia inconspicua]|uniref:Uncharacterized protein n=1 Tax=Nitzschia inconspicua TaxID=303405 RepID=A0A9K3M1R1_9STRA|nr:hypothetical protein IV203_018302 [Nitzschia inconspicua]
MKRCRTLTERLRLNPDPRLEAAVKEDFLLDDAEANDGGKETELPESECNEDICDESGPALNDDREHAKGMSITGGLRTQEETTVEVGKDCTSERGVTPSDDATGDVAGDASKVPKDVVALSTEEERQENEGEGNGKAVKIPSVRDAAAIVLPSNYPNIDNRGRCYPSLWCKICLFRNQEMLLLIGYETYNREILVPDRWWETGYIATFAALLGHSVHRPDLMFVHCQEENSIVTEGLTENLGAKVKTVLSVVHSNDHYAVMEIHIDSRTICICDGMSRSLHGWQQHVLHVLKRTRMIAIDCKPTFVDGFGTTFVEPGKSADTVHLMINNSRELTIKKTIFVRQKDGWNCGPIACMKLWTMFAPGEVDVCSLHPQEYKRVVVAKFNALVRTLMKEITWSAEENSERRKCELKKSSEQSVIVDTETRSGTKTAGSSIGEDGGRQPPKTETDVRNEARRVACIKRKRNQEIQAEKMVRLRNETLQHVTPGTVVSMKMDPRDVKRARGLLGIACDRSGNRAGGVQVATGEGIVTADYRRESTSYPQTLCCAKSAGSGIA